jgi:hypothetical protein
MAEFERTAVVSADPGMVYDLLANPRETARWTRAGLHLRPQGEGGGQGTAALGSIDLDALFSVSPEQRRIDWSNATAGYAGWAQVFEHSGMGADVSLHVSLTGDLEPVSARDMARVTEDLDSVLDGLCTRLEGCGS